MKQILGTSGGSNQTNHFSKSIRRRTVLGLSAAAAVMAMAHANPAQAQTSLYWDVNGNSPGAGGPTATGSWSDTNTNWNTASDGSSASPGTWTAGDIAVFAAGTDATGAYTVTMVNQETAAGLTVEEGSVSIGAGSATGVTLQGMGTLSVATGATMNSNSTLIGSDANADGFVKSGNGTLVFSQNELILGERDFNGGVVKISNQLNLGDIPSSQITGGGTILLNGATLMQTNTGNGGSFISQAISLDIGPNNGTVNFAITTGTGTTTIYGTGTSDLNTCVIRGTGTLFKTGTGEFRVEGAGMQNNTFPKLDVLNGLYRIGSATGGNFETGFGAAPASPTADAITMNGGSIGTSFNCTMNANRGITLGANGGTIFQNAGSGLTDPANITGPGGLTVLGPATFSGVNDYQGATTIACAVGSSSVNTTLVISGGNAIPDTSAVSLNNNAGSVALLSVAASEVVGSIAGTGNVSVATNATITAGHDNTSTQLTGQILGTGNIAKVGSGTWTLSGNTSYSGSTTIAGGTLKVNNNSYTPLLSNAAGTDIQKGKLLIDYSAISGAAAVKSSIISTLASEYASGFSSGQIKSSTAGGQFGLGYKDDTANQLFTVAYTRYGDANLDGSVDSNDFSLLAANYGKTSGATWNLGDFNYDGTVNALDFNALATNYGQPIPQSGDLPDGALAAGAMGLGSLVPEPTSIGLLGIAALGLAGRRQRRN